MRSAFLLVLTRRGSSGPLPLGAAALEKRANLSHEAMLEQTADPADERVIAAAKGRLVPVERLIVGFVLRAAKVELPILATQNAFCWLRATAWITRSLAEG